MDSDKFCLSVFALLGAAACSSVPEDLPSNSQTPPSSAEVHAGFRQRLGVSAFDPGDVSDITLSAHTPPVVTRSYVESGFQKVSGPRGVFALNPTTGFSMAQPTAEVVQAFKPLGSSAEEHHARVREYFVKAGLPADQIESVQGGADLMEKGEVGVVETREVKLIGYHTLITRSIGGVRIVESRAFAMLADSGRPILEGVYWPTIPRSVVEEALSFRIAIKNGELAVLRAAMSADISPADAEQGEVVVHHRPAWWQGDPIETKVSYDVHTAQGTRHFDRQAVEFRVPDEVSPR